MGDVLSTLAKGGAIGGFIGFGTAVATLPRYREWLYQSFVKLDIGCLFFGWDAEPIKALQFIGACSTISIGVVVGAGVASFARLAHNLD
jgi:hypothetical protein